MAASAPEHPSRAALLAELSGANERLLATVGGLDDGALKEPSALPGWSRGHVVTHLARNADGLARLVSWATTGVEAPMYASRAARAAEIEAGAGRPLAEQVVDLEHSCRALAARLEELPPSADDVVLRTGGGGEIEGWELPLVRIREVEVHHVDLAAGVTADSWSQEFCVRTLDQVAPGFAARGDVPVGILVAHAGRVWRVGPSPTELSGPLPLLLGWLLGRDDGSRLVPSGRDDVPPAPPWA